MTNVTIRNIDVKFPFPPYEIQKQYMEKVLECLEKGQTGILESPTGTGKTLSLLCSSLAWLEKQKKKQEEEIAKLLTSKNPNEESKSIEIPRVPKIFYTSRTHSQLVQAMREMKRCGYSHMKACILGSREQMCIDEEVLSEPTAALKMLSCYTKTKYNKCVYRKRVDTEMNKPPLCNNSIVDIEDLVSLGREKSFCPYFMARNRAVAADIVFMPYNYLVDLRSFKAMDMVVSHSVIIFDEAHNIEKACEEAVSMQIKNTDIQATIEDLLNLKKRITEGDVDFHSDSNFDCSDLANLKDIFENFKKSMESIQIVKTGSTGTVFDGDHIFKMFSRAGICDSNFQGISTVIAEVQKFITENKITTRGGHALSVLADLIFVAFYKIGPEFRTKIKECFKIQFENQFEEFNSRRFQPTYPGPSRVLNFWCFSPGFRMKMLMDQNLHSIILTSGTLAPLKPLLSELEISADVRIENPHIISNEQIFVKILGAGPDHQPLISNYQNRDNPKYLQSLGFTVLNLCKIIPDGVLIFFPSYALMEKCIDFWRDNQLWESLNRIKPVSVEPKEKNLFKTTILDYYSKIKDPSYNGAIFMGVCRGKVSEGLDFADVNGRAVLITGLPYAPLKDAKVILKRDYLDLRNRQDKMFLRGSEWYNLDAIRAVNQAIGRVIRNQNDYGAIILLDSRFTGGAIQNNLSMWLRKHISEVKNFGEIIRGLGGFFRVAAEKFPCQPKDPLLREVLEIDEDEEYTTVKKQKLFL